MFVVILLCSNTELIQDLLGEKSRMGLLGDTQKYKEPSTSGASQQSR